MSRSAKKQKVEKTGAVCGDDSSIVYSLELLKQAEHQKIATKHATTKLSDVPDDALAAECGRRNLQIVSSFGCSDGEDAVEKLIDSRYTKLRLLGQGSSGTVYEVRSFSCEQSNKLLTFYLCTKVSPKSDPEKKYALKSMLKGTGNAEGYENNDEDMSAEVSFLKRLHHPCIGGCVEVFESTKAFHLILEGVSCALKS
jgi:hypothetical protein